MVCTAAPRGDPGAPERELCKRCDGSGIGGVSGIPCLGWLMNIADEHISPWLW